jgi:hypothetical protein
MQQFSFIDLFIDLFETALHVSGYKLAHLQEHFLTVYTAFGTIHGYCCRSAVAQWLRCCATNRKVAGSIAAGVIGIFY